MPEDENSLCLESFFSLDEVFNPVLAVVANFSPQVVDEEWLSEVVFIVGEGHGLEVKSHHGSSLNISEFILASSGV